MLVQTGLEGQVPPGLPPEDLMIIEHEVRRMEQRIQMFLDFARPPRSERRQADLISLLRASLSLVEGRARKQKVKVAANFPEPPVNLFIDSEQINQVFVNLLLNALDALPRGGTIVVEVAMHAPVPVPEGNGAANSASRGNQVMVRITDSGPGIAARIQERLFQPFVTSKETGMGLGLSICKRLIEAHGGTISGNNRQEGGAEFVFTLPA
jgi:two-component system sensor histidine kinase HydH